MTCIIQMNCSEFSHRMKFWSCLQADYPSWKTLRAYEKQIPRKSSITSITCWDIMESHESALDIFSLKSQGDKDIHQRNNIYVQQVSENQNVVARNPNSINQSHACRRGTLEKLDECNEESTLVCQLENDWVEEPSNCISPPCDTLKTDLPWRLSLDEPSDIKSNCETRMELQIPSVTCFDTISNNPSVQSEVDVTVQSYTVSAINSEECNELSFLNPEACWGEIIVMEKSDLEMEIIDVEGDDTNNNTQEISSFKFSVELDVGRISRNKFGLWVCKICNETYKTLRVLKRHVRRHYSECMNECLECHISFDNPEDLNFHQVSHILSSLVLGHICQHCHKSFRRKHLLEKHVANEHSNLITSCRGSSIKKFRETCGKCVRVFYSSFEMEDHDESCTEGIIESEESSSEAGDLPNAVPMKKGRRRTACYLCKLTFDSVQQLTTHFEKFHGSDKPLKCEVFGCDKLFSNRFQLKRHRVYKHFNKGFECHICAKKYTEKVRLTDHIRTHTGEKPFKCRECEMAFHSRDILNKHLKNHKTKFKCGKCDKQYTSSFSLLRHQAYHDRDKQHLCEHCGKKFLVKAELSKHVKAH